MADTTTNTQNTASLSGLISAGEDIFTAITGKSSANVEKVTSGLSAVGDGLLPTLESKVNFDLGRVIAGATGIFAGVALVLAGLKKKSATAAAAASAATTGTAQTATTGGVGWASRGAPRTKRAPLITDKKKHEQQPHGPQRLV